MIGADDHARAAGSILLRGADAIYLHALVDACSTRELTEGEVLLAQGQDNDRLYVILSGRLDVHLDSAGPQPYVSLGPGHCAGEISLIDGQRPSASVVAVEPTR